MDSATEPGLLVLAVSTDKQPPSGLHYVSLLRRETPHLRVVLAGNQAAGMARALHADMPGLVCERVGHRPRSGESGVALAIYLVEHALGPEGANARYLIAGRPEALGGVAERLSVLGREARWTPMLSPELLDDTEAGRAHARFRELVMRVLAHRNRLPLEWVANRMSARWPALACPDERQRLFGHRQYRRICEAVGLRVQGSWVVRS